MVPEHGYRRYLMDSQVSIRKKVLAIVATLLGLYCPLSFVEGMLWGQCPPSLVPRPSLVGGALVQVGA